MFDVGRTVVVNGHPGVVVATEPVMRVELPGRGDEPFVWEIGADDAVREPISADEARALVARMCTTPTGQPPTDLLCIDPDRPTALIHEFPRATPQRQAEACAWWFRARSQIPSVRLRIDDRTVEIGPRGDAALRLAGEIAHVLGLSRRHVYTALEAGDATLGGPAAPATFERHEYLGAFFVDHALTIGDPCYLREARRRAAAASLVTEVAAAGGPWHAWLEHGGHPDDPVSLLALHAGHLATSGPWKKIGGYGVDSGCAAIVGDGIVNVLPEEGEGVPRVLGDAGCFSHTRHGDGMFAIRGVALRDRRVVAVRVALH